MTNTGKVSEAIFEGFFLKLGKRAFVHRVTDAAEVRGRSQGLNIIVKKQPSDYIVTANGEMFYAEVKSTEDKTAFRKSQIEDGQWVAAVKQTAAGGDYFFFVHALKSNLWYCIPAAHLIKSEAKSWKWEELKTFIIQ